MSVNLYVVCEGQSENAFVRKILIPYIGDKTGWKITIMPYTVVTSRDKRAGKIHRGGLSTYQKAKSDIIKCFSKGDYVTTMFDYYALPKDFPGYEEADKLNHDIDKVRHLEQRLGKDLGAENNDFRDDHFLPYIQLHEFETLFYTDLSVLKLQYLSESEKTALDELIEETKLIAPEDVNSGAETAPSKRLIKSIHYKKGSAVVYPLEKIGIDAMRKECPHFDEWIKWILEIGKG